MKKSFNSTLVLLGCLVLLLGWYVGYEKKFRVQSEQAEEKAKELVTLDRSTIMEIDLERLKNALTDAKGKTVDPSEIETIKLRRTGIDWHILAPIEYPADNTQIESLVTSAVTTKYERIVDEHPKDLDAFGLKTPLVKVTFRKDATSPAQTILLGRDTPTGTSAYMKFGDKEAVYRVSRIARTAYEKPLKDLRDKTIVNAPSGQVSEVEIQAGKESIVAKKDEKSNWQLLREGMPADAAEWNKTLNAVLDAKAKEFLDAADPKAYGLKPPAVTVTVTKIDKSKVTATFGETKDKAYAMTGDKKVIFEVDKELLKKLKQPGSTYVDKHVAQFNRFDASRVRITKGTEGFELVKDPKKSEWSFSDQANMPADKRTTLDKPKIDTLLTNLQDMKADKFLKGGEAVEDPSLKIEIWETTSTAEPKVVLNLKSEGKTVLGQRNGVNVPFALSAADYKKIDVGKKDFEKEKKETEPKKSASQTPDKGKG